MARKNLLTGLLGDELPAGNSADQAAPEAEKAAPPHLGVMGTRGAIGAVTRSIEQLKAHSIVEIPPELIEASFIADRLESTPESHRALVELDQGARPASAGAGKAASPQGRPLPDRLWPPAA